MIQISTRTDLPSFLDEFALPLLQFTLEGSANRTLWVCLISQWQGATDLFCLKICLQMNFVLSLLPLSLPLFSPENSLIPLTSSGISAKIINRILCHAIKASVSSNLFYNFIQVHPMAAVATAERGLIVYQLENQPSEFRRIESPLKHQVNDCIYYKRIYTDFFLPKHGKPRISTVFQNQSTFMLVWHVSWFGIDLLLIFVRI